MTTFGKALFNDALALAQAYSSCDTRQVGPQWCDWGQHETLDLCHTDKGCQTCCKACMDVTVVCANCDQRFPEYDSSISTNEQTGETQYFCEACHTPSDPTCPDENQES